MESEKKKSKRWTILLILVAFSLALNQFIEDKEPAEPVVTPPVVIKKDPPKIKKADPKPLVVEKPKPIVITTTSTGETTTLVVISNKER